MKRRGASATAKHGTSGRVFPQEQIHAAQKGLEELAARVGAVSAGEAAITRMNELRQRLAQVAEPSEAADS